MIGSEIHLDVSYLHYLYDARNRISTCARACRIWSSPYDGVTPPPEDKTRPRVTSQAHTDVTSSSGVELEWDDSYDAGSSARARQEEEEETNGATAGVQNDPPQHIQELRKTATLFVKGSYVEESEFQNDVMVYDLVAQKDTNESADRKRIVSSHERQDDRGAENPDDLSEASEIGNGSVQPDTEKQNGVQMEADQNPHDPVTEHYDDLVAQYEELIRTLVIEAKSPTRTQQELRNSIMEEEDDVDFSSFSAKSPEAEKSPSPFRTKPHSGSVNHAIPFTGETLAGSQITHLVFWSGTRHRVLLRMLIEILCVCVCARCIAGPFMSVLLSRLENMLENSLHVNLLLTGIIAQLAAYPQPLLRSFLLNTNMVFQPSVHSLYQVTHLHYMMLPPSCFTGVHLYILYTRPNLKKLQRSKASGHQWKPH